MKQEDLKLDDLRPLMDPQLSGVEDRLDHVFQSQSDFQKMLGENPHLLQGKRRCTYFSNDVLALTDELHEALDEIGWKPWATSDHFNEEAVKSELVDVFHFFMNLCIVAHMTPHDLYEGYLKKQAKNRLRQVEGYDGVSTKCPKCHRALDDDAVICYSPGYVDGQPQGYCDQEEVYYG